MNKIEFYFFILSVNVIYCGLINFVSETSNHDLIQMESNESKNFVDLTDDEYQNECLQAHNEVRRLHGSNDLIFDEKLLEEAKSAVYDSVLNGRFTQNPDSPYGINLASSSKKLTCEKAVQRWYKQQSSYNYGQPTYNKLTGAFTQLIWRDTKKYACAQGRSNSRKLVFFTVCTYDPFGNVENEYADNVKPPINAKSNTNNHIINSNSLTQPANSTHNSTYVSRSRLIKPSPKVFFSPSQAIRSNITNNNHSS